MQHLRSSHFSRIALSSKARSIAAAAELQPLASYRQRLLSESQLDQFHKEGFLFLPNLLTDSEKTDLVKWTKQVQSWPETAGKWMQYFESSNNKRMLCRTENYLDYHEGLRSLIRGKIADAVSEAMDEPAVLFKEKINYKFSGGSGFTAHQDAPAYVTFAARYHITAMVAVDAMTRENGCLEVVRGEHRRGMMPHPGGVIDKSITDEYDSKQKWECVTSPIGGIMIFHSYLPHKSGKNTSNAPRRAHYLTYNPLSDGDFRADYYAQKRRAFPPDIERVPGVDYSEGAKVFNVSNPIPTKL